MNKKEETFFLIGAAGLVIIGLLFIPLDYGYLGIIIDSILPLNWDEVREREIVKNAIPINLLDEDGENCKVTADRLDAIIDQVSFVRSSEFESQVKYDREDSTAIFPCDMLKGEKSKLTMWYVDEEGPKHPTKFEYWITDWNSTQPNLSTDNSTLQD